MAVWHRFVFAPFNRPCKCKRATIPARAWGRPPVCPTPEQSRAKSLPLQPPGEISSGPGLTEWSQLIRMIPSQMALPLDNDLVAIILIRQSAPHHEDNIPSRCYHCITRHARPGSGHDYRQSGAGYERHHRHIGGFEYCRRTLLRASGHAREFSADARTRIGFGKWLCSIRSATVDSGNPHRNLSRNRSAGMVFRVSDLRSRPRVRTAFHSRGQVHSVDGYHRRITLATPSS